MGWVGWSTATANHQVATNIGPVIVICMVVFGGFYVNVESLPVFIQWMQWLSLMRYSFKGFVINEFKGVTFSCEDVATVSCLCGWVIGWSGRHLHLPGWMRLEGADGFLND